SPFTRTFTFASTTRLTPTRTFMRTSIRHMHRPYGSISPLHPDPRSLRIVKRLQARLRREAFAGDLDFVIGAAQFLRSVARRAGNIAQADRRAQMMSVI